VNWAKRFDCCYEQLIYDQLAELRLSRLPNKVSLISSCQFCERGGAAGFEDAAETGSEANLTNTIIIVQSVYYGKDENRQPPLIQLSIRILV
jgi:hypothetical protein